eukprot:scaffold29599_cov96-Isochrysis_galbana.AAC.1
MCPTTHDLPPTPSITPGAHAPRLAPLAVFHQVDEGFYGAWFEGEIVEHVYPDKCVIKYLELREVRCSWIVAFVCQSQPLTLPPPVSSALPSTLN